MTTSIENNSNTHSSHDTNNNHQKKPNMDTELDLDGWKILDPLSDDECQSIGDNVVSNVAQQQHQQQTKVNTLTNGSNIEYIEVKPFGEKQNQFNKPLSPFLIHLCTAIYSFLPLASLSALILLIVLLFTKYYYVTILYTLYAVWDRKTCNKGGKRWNFIYNSSFWSYLGAYFPIKLRYSNSFTLNPNENYILSYHPHGISAFGSVVALATNGLNFTKLFPGIKSHFMVHETSFYVPVMRETFALRGDCSVNSQSIDHMLTRTKSGSGNLLTIVVGGLAEADMSDMETLRVMVAKRKGFVKKALIHKANLIPCIAFGENSVFTKINFSPKSLIYRLENGWHKLFGFKHPVYHGRSIISSKSTGVMPYKRPITVVMGDPIMVDKQLANPSQKDIDDLHAIYLDRLKILYESNQDLCSKYDTQMVIV